MKLPAKLEKTAAKFNQMSIRERALVAAAMLAAVVMTWTIAIYDPMTAKERALISEIASIQENMSANLATMEAATENDPAGKASTREKQLAARLSEIDAQLDSKSAGLIPPERMIEVIHDVLTRQHGVKLISLHNKPVTSLIEPTAKSKRAADAESGGGEIAPASSGPYMHPVELVIEGRYLDILAYLRALESLSWHSYWKDLELQSTEYPLNRVRIELGTLSMDKEWIGV